MNFTHPAAKRTIKSKIFEGINNFLDLEQIEASGFDFAPFEKIWHRGYMLLLDEVYGLVGQSSEVNDIKGQVSGFWRGFKNPKGNDKAIVSLRQDDEKDGVTLGLWITKNREDIKQLPATLNFPNRQRLLAQIPGWYRNPSDYRTVDYEDAKKEQIELLWESYKDDQELAVVFLYALYAGLRLHEMLTAEVFHIKNRSYIEIKPSKGSAAYRRVPLHPKLRHVPLEFTSTYGAISARLSKKKNRSLKATTHITSLNYALYAELINRGIDSLDLVALTHGKEETFWDDAVNTRLLNLFKKVEF